MRGRESRVPGLRMIVSSSPMRSFSGAVACIGLFFGIGQRLSPLEGTVSPRGLLQFDPREGVAFAHSPLKLSWVHVCAETGRRQIAPDLRNLVLRDVQQISRPQMEVLRQVP